MTEPRIGLSDHFTQRQIDRLYVVGSNETTAPIIEAAYTALLAYLTAIMRKKAMCLVHGHRRQILRFLDK